MHGLTQEQFAEKAELDYKYYQLFELGRTGTPSLRMIEALAQVMKVKPWVLLCDDPTLISRMTKIPETELCQQVKPRPGRPRKWGLQGGELRDHPDLSKDRSRQWLH